MIPSSLEGIINLSVEPVLEDAQRDHVKRQLYQIANQFENVGGGASAGSQYNRALLVRLTYEYASSEQSQGIFLRAFAQSMELSIDEGEDEDIDFSNSATEERFRSALFGFADFLLDNFFLPLKASTKKTPQPSPAYHSAVQNAQAGVQDISGTPDRISTLRGACLVRDRHRCVISRGFDQKEALQRGHRDGNKARDDDGSLLMNEVAAFEDLEVAHILPHSLMQVDSNSRLNPSKEAALTVLNMFDSGVVHLIEGTDVDRPRNALTLTHNLHQLFGDFRVFFTPTGEQPHTYRIDKFLPPFILRDVVPVTRTLYLTETRTIEPPSARLLKIHCAIAHILHLSAAGEYIDKILLDMEEQGIRADGSTDLGRLLKLRLDWGLDGTVEAY